ncbi:MAG: hypothetical protein KDB90_14945 [Planctomycetes bacterium]|nr:hypothetical protein [Planctomycetota bacterium]
MKLSRYVCMFWAGNLILLVCLGAYALREYSQTGAHRDATYATALTIKTRLTRHNWQEDGETQDLHLPDTMLSPTERPKPAEPAPETPKPTPQVEKSDEQLKSELTAELNRKFSLLRLALSSTDEYPTIATVVSGSVRMQWFEGMDLKEEYGRSASAELNRLAYDLKILCIDEYGVLVNAASFEKPEKRFDVRIKPFEGKQTNNMLSADYIPDGKALKPIGEIRPVETPYQKDRPAEQAERWGYEVPKEDFDEQAVDDFARYTKSTEHGLQILPELPQDSPARKYGARGGEIIKTINGKSVKTMSDVRREVRTQYDAGTREFRVGYEKDGVPDERTFKAPK